MSRWKEDFEPRELLKILFCMVSWKAMGHNTMLCYAAGIIAWVADRIRR